MIECYSDLHVLVLSVRITVPQKHNLVMMGHVIVGDGDGRGSMNGINETITTIRQRAMINPNMLRIKDGHTITVRLSPKPRVMWRVSNVGVPRGLAIMNVNTMDNNVTNIVYSNASPISNVNTSTPSINCLEGIHQKLFF